MRHPYNGKITFIATETGTLDLPTVVEKSLDDIEWLIPREVAQYYPPPIEPQTRTGRKWFIVLCVNIAIIAGFFAIRFLYLYLKNR